MVCNFSSHFGFTTLEVNPMAQAQGQAWIWATQELGRDQLDQDKGARRWLARSKVKEKEKEEQTCSKQHQPHLSRTLHLHLWPCKRALHGPWKRSSTKQGLAKGLLEKIRSCKRAPPTTTLGNLGTVKVPPKIVQ